MNEKLALITDSLIFDSEVNKKKLTSTPILKSIQPLIPKSTNIDSDFNHRLSMQSQRIIYKSDPWFVIINLFRDITLIYINFTLYKVSPNDLLIPSTNTPIYYHKEYVGHTYYVFFRM